ncbi:MAG: tetratricopeptide repeat protein [Planctomycetota bacterium]
MRAPPLPARRGVALAVLLAALAVPRLATAEMRRDLAAEACRAAGRGEHDRALALSQEVVDGAPGDALAWRVRGYVLSQATRTSEALDAYDRSLALDPGSAVAANNSGAMLLKLGRVEEALARFEDALRMDPGYADARNNRGAALERMGRTVEAVGEYRQALSNDPRHARARSNLGAVAWRRGKLRAAANAFREAVGFDPGFEGARMNLALLREAVADEDAHLAAAEAEAAVPGATAEAKARPLVVRAGRHARNGELEAARDLYLQALAYLPRDVALLNNLAVVEDQLGLDREALLHLGEALMLDGALLVARNNVGIVHVHRGELDIAESAFRDLLRDAPRFHRAHYNLGVLLAARGQAEAAMASFREANRLAPWDAEAAYNYAMMRRRLGGDIASERRGYEHALRLDDNLAEAHLALGMLLADPATPQGLRDTARARGHLTRFLQLARPTDEQGRMQAEGWLHWLSANR